jgi:hypothetical protein
MGYIKSPEPSSTVDMIGSPYREASGIPLRSYETGATFTEMVDFEKGRFS